ncbi:P-loop NTPase fold protein [Megamonas rupellensis]|uniref:P-loop NTPase fold protein n=2 Tax=Megamonas TaxID=158846 RepID=UPI00037F09B3|nr:P-loop NTPase fold protein [Megamonas rupellensis]
MNINNDELINIVTDYLLEDRYTQAILIDGKWGTGKTFFVKEKLIPTLKDNTSLKFAKIYYLSLYDIKDLTELTNKIYLALFENFFKNKFGKNITNKLNLFSKAINIGLNALNNSNILGFNITKDDLPKFEDLID